MLADQIEQEIGEKRSAPLGTDPVGFGGESGIRTRGGLASSPVFKTGAFSQLDHLSLWALSHVSLQMNALNVNVSH